MGAKNTSRNLKFLKVKTSKILADIFSDPLILLVGGIGGRWAEVELFSPGYILYLPAGFISRTPKYSCKKTRRMTRNMLETSTLARLK